MSFLNGLFLLALPLAAVPVLLHLYRRRQKEVVPWGAMQFLESAATQGRRWEHLEELLLMLLRTAAVLALVLGVSRPLLRGSWWGGGANRDVVLVLDDSLSSSRESSGTSAFEELRSQADEMIGRLKAGDRLHVMLAAGGPRWLTSTADSAASADPDVIREQLGRLQPSRGAAKWMDCLKSAVAAELSGEAGARHIVVVADRQAYGWQAESEPAWHQFHEFLAGGEVPTTLQVVLVGPDEPPASNLAVMRADASRLQAGPDEVVDVTVQIRNAGTQRSGAARLNTTVNQVEHESLVVPALRPGESTSLHWTWRANEPGVFALSGRLEPGDQVPLDDDGSVIVEVVDQVPVLVVESPPGYDGQLSGTQLFLTALGHQQEAGNDTWQSIYRPHVIDLEELETASLDGYRAVIVTDLPAFGPRAAERLRGFVERGGGLWLALGRATNREAFNALWYDGGGGLSPLPLLQPVTRSVASQEEETVHPPQGDHPATSNLADTRRLDIDTVRIRTRHQFDRAAGDESLSVLLQTGTGDPLVVEQYVGRGRVIVQAVPFGVEWSNLPLTKAFVVMVQDGLDYLTQPAATQFNLQPGGRIAWSPTGRATSDTAVLIAPDESETSLADTGDVPAFQFSPAVIPGLYELQYTNASGGSQSIPFAVARDAEESDLTPLDREQQTVLADAGGVGFINAANFTLPPTEGAQAQRPIWNTLLAGLLLVFIAEGLLATRAALRRAGFSGDSASPDISDGFVSAPTTREDITHSIITASVES